MFSFGWGRARSRWMRKWEGTKCNDRSEITCENLGGWGYCSAKVATCGHHSDLRIVITKSHVPPGWANHQRATARPRQAFLRLAYRVVPVHPCVWIIRNSFGTNWFSESFVSTSWIFRFAFSIVWVYNSPLTSREEHRVRIRSTGEYLDRKIKY
jgi:hypothetical protein